MLIDSHIHLYDARFKPDFGRVIERARDEGVMRMVCIADDTDTSAEAIRLAARVPGVYATVGIHPGKEERFGPGSIAALRELAKGARVVAIGEIGIDYHYPGFRKGPQAEAFLAQARLASELGLPMVIHCRDAYRDLIEHIRRETDITARGVVHCFTGTTEEAEELIGLGFLIGMGGAVTYPKAEGLRETVRRIGLSRIVAETDAPYLPPQTRRGRRNEPAYMREAVATMAGVCGVDYLEAARTTTANTCELYGLPPIDDEKRQRGLPRRVFVRVEGGSRVLEPLQGLDASERCEEFVICGGEEPTRQLITVIAMARELKRRGGRVVLETDGTGNRSNGRNIVPELAGLIDAVCVTAGGDGGNVSDALHGFIAEARRLIPDVVMEVRGASGLDVEKWRMLAARLRVRFRIGDGESRQ